MFDPRALSELRTTHAATLASALKLRSALNARFFGMDKAVHAMILAAMTGESMVMIGPPGTSKSRLVRSFCELLELLPRESLTGGQPGGGEETRRDERYFEYLLTQFTEPSELFGHYDLARLFGGSDGRREFVRDTAGMMQKAEVVFLDEVFNASSAILNALLTFMNERKFHDRGKVIHTPMRLLFSATNHPPREEGLGAVYDRFLLRVRLRNVSEERQALPALLAGLADTAWRETHAPKLEGQEHFGTLLQALNAYRADIDCLTKTEKFKVQKDDPLFARLADLVSTTTGHQLSLMSNRRIVKFMAVFLANALLRSAETGEAPRMAAVDLETLVDYGLDGEDPGLIEKMRAELRMRG